MKAGKDLAIVSLGPIGNVAADAIAELEKETQASIAHYDLRFLKPLDTQMLNEIGERFDKIVTVEDGARIGGMGTAILEYMEDNGWSPRIKRLGLPDQFVPHGSPDELYRLVGLDKDSIKQAAKQLLADPTLTKS